MMGFFTETDRAWLNRLCDVAEAAVRPPVRLNERVEPVWSALLIAEERELASAVFLPGDKEDAVKKLAHENRPDATLYLTLEPNAEFSRLPPVTESIRRLGVKRVVIGALDPKQKLRGEGTSVLERMGVEVVLADGEEARRAQYLIDDYSKWLQRGLAVLRARVELHSLANGNFDLRFSRQLEAAHSVDAVLYHAGKVPAAKAGRAWQVVLDAEGWERPAEGRIVYHSSEAPMVAGTRRIAFQNGLPDFGALLRDLASLGIVSVEIGGDLELLQLALRYRLIEGLQFPDDTVQALAKVDKVRLTDGDEPLEIRFNNTRYSELEGGARYLEARVELC